MQLKQQIYEFFLTRIREGQIPIGSKLPTEKEIGLQFGVSRSTVQSVMERMANEGIVRRYAGRGTFACHPVDERVKKVNLDIHNIQSFEDEMALEGSLVAYRLVSFSEVPVPPRAAEKLGVEAGRSVLSLYRTRFVGDVCVGSENRYFSPDLTFDVPTAALATTGVHDMLEQHLGIVIGRIDAMLRASLATQLDADALGVMVGSPLLVRSHTVYSDAETPLFYGDAKYPEPFSFRYSAGVSQN